MCLVASLHQKNLRKSSEFNSFPAIEHDDFLHFKLKRICHIKNRKTHSYIYYIYTGLSAKDATSETTVPNALLSVSLHL